MNLSQREFFYHYVKGLAESHLEYHFQFLSLWCKGCCIEGKVKKKAMKMIQGQEEPGQMEKSENPGLC